MPVTSLKAGSGNCRPRPKAVAVALFNWAQNPKVNVDVRPAPSCLDGIFLGPKHAIRGMTPRCGCIVNVSSASGIRPSAGASAYSTSTAAVGMFTRTVAKERRSPKCPSASMPLHPQASRHRCGGRCHSSKRMTQRGSEEGAFQALSERNPGVRCAEAVPLVVVRPPFDLARPHGQKGVAYDPALESALSHRRRRARPVRRIQVQPDDVADFPISNGSVDTAAVFKAVHGVPRKGGPHRRCGCSMAAFGTSNWKPRSVVLG